MEKKIFKGFANRNQIFAFFNFQSSAKMPVVGLGNLLAQYEAPSAGGFREEVENVKISFLSYNFMTDVGGATNT